MDNILVEFQKIIYQNIKDDLSIFSYVEKNTNFPYGVVNMENIIEEKNFNYNLYKISLNVNIFDKNKSNVNIINITNKIKNNILKLIGINNEYFEILDISYNNNELKLYNDIEGIWSSILKLNIIIRNGK